jgi:hypothetical protein
VRRGGFHLRRMNQIKNRSALKYGWEGYLWLKHNLLPEINWWMSSIATNIPIRASIRPIEAILRTDASGEGWGITFITLNNN